MKNSNQQIVACLTGRERERIVCFMCVHLPSSFPFWISAGFVGLVGGDWEEEE